MTALIVITVIVLIFAFLLNMKVRAEISFLGGKFDIKVKYLCFTFFPVKEKKHKPKKEKKQKQKQKSDEQLSDIQPDSETDTTETEETSVQEEAADEKSKDKKEKQPLSEKIDKILSIIEKLKVVWEVSKKWIAHIFKHIYFENLMIDFTIADEDAYKASMNYGKINAVIYNLINLIRTVFTVTVKTVDIVCDFETKKSVYDCSVKITVRPATILSAVFGILFGLLLNIKKLIGNNKPSKKPKTVSN